MHIFPVFYQVRFQSKAFIALLTVKVVNIGVCGPMLLYMHGVRRALATKLAGVGVFPLVGRLMPR